MGPDSSPHSCDVLAMAVARSLLTVPPQQNAEPGILRVGGVPENLMVGGSQ